MSEQAAVGLCFDCRWMQTSHNNRGSTFYRCLRADTDPTYKKYPPLPVLECPGYEHDYFTNKPTP